MKKVLNYILLIMTIFIYGNSVRAETIKPSEIENNSYVIGNYLFTSKTVLSTRHIMLAAKTIQALPENEYKLYVDDMIIYYKTPRGKWIEGLSGEAINVPDSFEIDYKDSIKYDGDYGVGATGTTINQSNIENNTYVIGWYMFSPETVLSTRHIMFASRTILKDSVDDMIIYYKTPRGKWIEGLSGNSIAPPQDFFIGSFDLKSLPTVTFDAQGGVNELNKMPILKGAYYGELPTPARYGYKFDGWYTSKIGGTKVESTTLYTSITDTTLYARWSAKKQTITFDANQGEVSTSKIEFLYDSNYTDLPTPTRTGYKFEGWYTDKDGGTKITTNTKVQAIEPQTLYAHWTAAKYKIRFYWFNENGITRMESKDVIFNEEYGELPEIEEKPGYTVDGWYTEQEGGTKAESTTKHIVASDVLLYARYTPIPNFELTLVNGNDKSVQIVAYDSDLELPNLSKTGYTFLGWYTEPDGGTKASSKYNFLTNITLYARWEPNTYTITFDAEGGEIPISSKNITYNSMYGALPVPTKDGYEFIRWYSSEDGKEVDSNTKYSIAKDSTLYAEWLASSLILPSSSNDNHFSNLNMYTDLNNSIKNITFENQINIPNNVVYSWNFSLNNTDGIIAYLIENKEPITSNYYDLYIQSEGQIYANPDMSSWFAELYNLETINGLELVDTSYVTNMSHMFYQTGYESKQFELDLSSFNTSRVTDMSYMFSKLAWQSTDTKLNISNFDTSKVTNMSGMFDNLGYCNETLSLDLSHFDTSKVTDMSNMFTNFGHSSNSITLNISNFDTSNVTNMENMFASAGYSTTSNFSLNVRLFNTKKVTNMKKMFYYTGYNCINFRINVENFDFDSAVDVSYMFYNMGYNAENLKTNLYINSANIKEYEHMFYSVAEKYNSQITINYIEEALDLVTKMIETKYTTRSNVVLGRKFTLPQYN